MFRASPNRRIAAFNGSSAIRALDAARALSNLFTVLLFGGAMGIVVLSFTRIGT